VHSARHELNRALALDPTNRQARKLDVDVRAAYRPQLELGMIFLSDSDDNAVWSRTASTSLALADGLRGFINANSAVASDPVRDARLTASELGLVYSHGRFQTTVAAGAHWLASSDAPDRTPSTFRATWSTRLARRTVMGMGYARHPFDDNAALMARDIDVDELEASFESSPAERTTVTGGVGGARLSDGNARRWLMGAVMHQIDARCSVGVYARGLGYDAHGSGYFSPDRFALAEARGGFSYHRSRWESSTRTGLGWQQVGSGSAGQFEWHVEQAASYRWASINQITASIGASNSANSATSGAYSSLTTGLAVRFGI
jgi:hypothetical protein